MADIRVTRQVSEALFTDTPNVYATQQYLMVLQLLTDPMAQSVTDTLALTDEVMTSGATLPTSSNMALVSSAVAIRDLPVSVGHTITFTSLGGRVVTFDGSNVLVLSHLIAHFNYVADRAPVGNVLALVQTVTSLSSLDTTSNLGLVQTVNVQAPIKPVIIQPLGLSSRTSTPHRAFITDTLGIDDFLVTPLPTQHVSHTISFVQDSPIGMVDDTINFTQSVTFSFSLTASNTMNLTDQLVMTAIWLRAVEHDNVVGHSMTWYEDTPCGKKNYTPFQGENTVALDVAMPRNTLQDPQGDTGNFSLYTPYLGVASSKVTLRKPELDNRDRNAYSRVSQETRGGKMIVYADPTWPKVRTLAVTIIGLTETQVDEFQDFMQATVGQEIGLTDWEGRLWKGFIRNPNEPAIQDGRNMWTVSFEFEGEMLDVEQPGNENGDGMAMNLSQAVTAVIV
jgi:hypothetical protein